MTGAIPRAFLESFNEAPAFLPGKIVNRAQHSGGIAAASMRPRHFCRGRWPPKNSVKKQHDRPFPASTQQFCLAPQGKFMTSQRRDDHNLLIYLFKQQREHSSLFSRHLSARADGQSVVHRHEAIHTIRVRRTTGSKALPRLDTLGLTSSAGPRSRNKT